MRRPGGTGRRVALFASGKTNETRAMGAMKLTIERTALLKSLSHVQSVVERRNTIPILSNVLIEVRGAKVA